MTFRFKAWVLILVLGVSGALAADFTGKCDIEFFATSTLHDFSGTVETDQITATLVGPPNQPQTRANASAKVSVLEIHTHKKGINKNMYKMFDSKHFPIIEGTITNIHPYQILQDFKAAGETACTIPLKLKIREATKTLMATVRPLKESATELTVSMEFDVSLKAYALKPASMMGLLKVGDVIKVKAIVTVNKPTPEPLFKDYIVPEQAPGAAEPETL